MNGESKLPEGWASVVLEDFIYIAARIGWRGLKRSEYTSSGPLLLAVKDIQEDGLVDYNGISDHLDDFRYDESPEIQLKENDVLITKDGTIGKIGYVHNLPQKSTTNSSILVVRPCNAIDTKYLFYYFRSPFFQTIVQEKITGSAVPHLFQKDIKKFKVFIPPLAEQRRIVAAVEALLARVNASRERLDRVPGLLKAFRQAVLAAAYDGRLTENWRTERQFSWSKIVVEKCGKWVGGATPSKAQDVFWVNGIIPWVTPKDMKKDFLLDSIDHITQRAVNESNIHLFPEGTVIFVVRGMILARDFPVAIMNRPFTINQDIRGIIPNEQVNGHFLMYMLKHDRKKILGFVKYSTHGTKRIESPDLKSWIIPLPPLPEQHEIVRRVESLFALADRIEQRVAAGKERADRLTHMILAKAFRGELVPTEADLARKEGREYEPASVLLERILASREKKDTKK